MQSSLSISWKTEPASPPQLYEDTLWFFDDDPLTAFKLESNIVKHDTTLSSETSLSDETSTAENKAEVVSKLLADLDHLDQLEDYIKEEPFSNWLEERDELFQDIRIEPSRGYTLSQPLAQSPQPRFKTEELKQIPQLHIISPQHAAQPAVLHAVAPPQDTSVLLQEFENVYDAVELNHGQLTPPQSPPLTDNHSRQMLTTLTSLHTIPITFTQPGTTLLSQPATTTLAQPPATILAQAGATLMVQSNVVSQPTSTVYYQSLIQPATPQPDLAHELAEVEELVRSRAENMVESWETAEKNLNPSSPSSSSSSGFSECSSDPEWIPEPVQASGNSILPERVSRGRKRMGKPYSRAGPEDKKSRKKEQNKNAATRYRMKKKAEIEDILTEEKGLADSNDQLQGKVTDIQREIKYLKGLMRDLFKAKGLLQ